MESYIFGQLISGINFNETPLCNEYEQCIFKNCIFHNCDLSHKIFRECKFESCDLSLSKMNNTTLSEIDFLGCKILGVQFNECRRFLLSFRFENCSLRLSVFYNLKLKEACFNKCARSRFHRNRFNQRIFSGVQLIQGNIRSRKFGESRLPHIKLLFHQSRNKPIKRRSFFPQRTSRIIRAIRNYNRITLPIKCLV